MQQRERISKNQQDNGSKSPNHNNIRLVQIKQVLKKQLSDDSIKDRQEIHQLSNKSSEISKFGAQTTKCFAKLQPIVQTFSPVLTSKGITDSQCRTFTPKNHQPFQTNQNVIRIQLNDIEDKKQIIVEQKIITKDLFSLQSLQQRSQKNFEKTTKSIYEFFDTIGDTEYDRQQKALQLVNIFQNLIYECEINIAKQKLEELFINLKSFIFCDNRDILRSLNKLQNSSLNTSNTSSNSSIFSINSEAQIYQNIVLSLIQQLEIQNIKYQAYLDGQHDQIESQQQLIKELKNDKTRTQALIKLYECNDKVIGQELQRQMIVRQEKEDYIYNQLDQNRQDYKKKDEEYMNNIKRLNLEIIKLKDLLNTNRIAYEQSNIDLGFFGYENLLLQPINGDKIIDQQNHIQALLILLKEKDQKINDLEIQIHNKQIKYDDLQNNINFINNLYIQSKNDNQSLLEQYDKHLAQLDLLTPRPSFHQVNHLLTFNVVGQSTQDKLDFACNQFQQLIQQQDQKIKNLQNNNAKIQHDLDKQSKIYGVKKLPILQKSPEDIFKTTSSECCSSQFKLNSIKKIDETCNSKTKSDQASQQSIIIDEKMMEISNAEENNNNRKN